MPLDGKSHASGTLDRAEAILAAYPEVARGNIHTAAILGDDVGVRQFLARDARSATAKGGPHGWDALTHLCFSRYLRLDNTRSDGFVRAAKALLDAGANANTGWLEKNHQPEPEWESAIYGAAGIAHHAELTRLLLERGADPNDGETPYHAPETYDNAGAQSPRGEWEAQRRQPGERSCFARPTGTTMTGSNGCWNTAPTRIEVRDGEGRRSITPC